MLILQAYFINVQSEFAGIDTNVKKSPSFEELLRVEDRTRTGDLLNHNQAF